MSLIFSGIATIISLGALFISWLTWRDNKKKEVNTRKMQPIKVTVHQKSETYNGLQSDFDPVRFENIVHDLTENFINEIGEDLGTLMAKRPDICFIDEPFLYVNVYITSVDESFLFNLQVPVFEFIIENGTTKIREPKWRTNQLVFQPNNWEEVRSRIDMYVRGKKYDSHPLKMKFSENFIPNLSPLKDKKLKLIIENSI